MPTKTGNRRLEETRQHNKVINFIAKKLQQQYKKRDYLVAINPGQTRNRGVKGLYPDVLLYHRKLRLQRLQPSDLIEIYEIETETTVNNAEARFQWLDYSKLNCQFYLCVPTRVIDFAKFLCERNKIKVKEILPY